MLYIDDTSQFDPQKAALLVKCITRGALIEAILQDLYNQSIGRMLLILFICYEIFADIGEALALKTIHVQNTTWARPNCQWKCEYCAALKAKGLRLKVV